jgi:hypothetical protein
VSLQQVTDGRMLLRIPQHSEAGGPIDHVDRVVVGAEFVRELVDAGL